MNFILKKRARRYVASATRGGLYPEARLQTTHWSRLGDEDFLMPDPRDLEFTTGTFVGFKDGSSWGVDEYGRPPVETPAVKRQRDRELRALRRRCEEWDRKYGERNNPFWMRRFGVSTPEDSVIDDSSILEEKSNDKLAESGDSGRRSVA